MAHSPVETRKGFGLLLSIAMLAALLLPASARQQPQQTPSPSPRQTPAPQRPKPTPRPAAAPADEDAVDESEVVRVTSNLVVVPVSVTDASGEAVPGLKIEDFRLEEEGRRQELAVVGSADEVPLDIALLIDASSSVRERFDFEKQAAAEFLKSVLKPKDKAAVFVIESKARLVQPLASAAEATAAVKAIPLPPSERAFTAFFDAVTEAARYLDKNAPGNHRRVIVALTDGDDTARIYDASLANKDPALVDLKSSKDRQLALIARAHQELLREVQRADAVFYSLNPSGNTMHLNVRTRRAQEGMTALASSTGGNAFVPAAGEDLEVIFRRIANELRAQYLLQYLSNNEAQPGKFLKIKVETPARAGLRVRARQGYYKKG